jgi:hypothetical protein
MRTRRRAKARGNVTIEFIDISGLSMETTRRLGRIGIIVLSLCRIKRQKLG